MVHLTLFNDDADNKTNKKNNNIMIKHQNVTRNIKFLIHAAKK